MITALISDIHANIHALTAVLEDIERRGIKNIYCLGDLVGYMPFPNEVIQLIRDNDIKTVQGNYDQSVGQDLMACGCDYSNPKDMEFASRSLLWTQENTTAPNKRFLEQLPPFLELDIDGRLVLLVHGSPRKNNEYLYENSQELKDTAAALKADILICGHTHLPYYKLLNGKHIINAGSVGKPKHMNPNAAYVAADITNTGIRVEIVQVPYDYEKTARAIEASSLPHEFSQLIRRG